jgi:hypothetical protein
VPAEPLRGRGHEECAMMDMVRLGQNRLIRGLDTRLRA